MNTVDLKINDQKVQVEKGTPIIEAAKEIGIDIPALCYHPELSMHGACRVCVVENKKTGELIASCANPVTDGMEILTNSEKAESARKLNLEFILANHPNDCMTCDSGGSCKLQELVYECEITEPRFGTLEESVYEIEQKNPFIEFDPNKCVLCGQCVRVCKEIQVSRALEFSERGADAKVMTSFGDDITDEDSSCVHCGQCVEICPTSALNYIPSKGKGREYNFDDKVQTTCGYCGVGCQLELRIKDNKVVEVGSVYQDGNPNPMGETCVKGRFAYDFINSEDRLTKPLIKENGRFVEASWEEALDFAAEKLTEVKEKYGGSAVGNLTSARCTNEENYLMQKFMRAVIGSNNVDHCAHL
jgi:formate dehydrogenase major subunit/formate dehydrogenase alpha subunit